MRQTLSLIILFIFILSIPVHAAEGALSTDDDPMIICIDAGHGGGQEGTYKDYHGTTVYEKDMDLVIALYLRDYLEEYYNVQVVMTRTSDIDVPNSERPDIAKNAGADYFISIHNNAPFDENDNFTGCMVLTSVSHYQPPHTSIPDLYESETRLARAVISSLGSIGIGISNDFDVSATGGILRRPYSPEGKANSTKTYPDGSVADYYGQIRFCTEYGIPAIIIEHAYVTTESDYMNYLSTDAQLRSLAFADAKAIADALHLRKP